MTDEILIQFHPDVPQVLRRRIVGEMGCVFKEEIVPQRIFVIRCPKGAALPRLLEQLRKRPEVAHVELNEEVGLFKGEGGG